jgi:hypothetical protein
MRFSALIPVLFSVGAFILTLLCVFAGSKVNFLENGNMVTLNTSQLGHFKAFSISDPSGSGSNGLDKFEDNLTSLGNDLLNGLSNAAGDVADDIAHELGLHDFYSAHLMGYCEGEYKGNATVKGAPKNVTACSKSEGMFWFDPREILDRELHAGVTLEDLDWPSEIDDGLKTLKGTSNAMFVFYMIGVAAAGLSILTGLAGLSGSRLISLANFTVTMIGFIALAVASILVTVIIVKAVHILNDFGKVIGLSAYRGSTFLGMTWAATALMLLASMVWVVECIMGRKRRTRVRHTKEVPSSP